MTKKEKHPYIQEVKELEDREVEILVEIPWADVEKEREHVLSHFKKEVEVKGFRKGAAPENKVVEKVGEDRLLHEMAQHALEHSYGEILSSLELDTIGRPSIVITKLTQGNPLGFKIKAALMPEVNLPDYTKIAKEVNAKEEKVEVTEKDVEETINHIREQWAKREKYQKELEKNDNDPQKVDPTSITAEEKDWPELTDEFVKQVGDFKDVSDFKKRLQENLVKEKEMQAKEKNRIALIEAIQEKTNLQIPSVVVESELEKMLAQFQGDVEKAGFKLEEYLKQTGKSIDDLKKEWRADAEKRAGTQLVLNKIATEEKLEADKKRVDEEVERVVKMYKDADPLRARVYIESLMVNEEVFKFLEEMK